MTQTDKTKAFAALHLKGDPIILYNIWDAGSAKTVAEAGAKAIATGSMSVAAAQGYQDGEAIPLNMLLGIASRIVETVDLPVSIDFEGGYAKDPKNIAPNIKQLIETGIIGINFEDQRVGGSGIYAPAVQQQRIAAVRQAAGTPLFINARTDLFLKQPDSNGHALLVPEAIRRAELYAQAGADCFFVPGLRDLKLISEICSLTDLPVNVMTKSGATSLDALASAGVSRISYGPNPYFSAMETLASTYIANVPVAS